MLISLAAAVNALLLLQLAGAEPQAACNKNNACYSAVSSNAGLPSAQQKPGCASFFKSTVTPRPVTKTASLLVTTTFCPTKFTTETPKDTVTKTATRTSTSVISTTTTIAASATVTNTIRTDTTTTTTSTSTNVITTTTTVYVTSTKQKRDIAAKTGCPTTPAGPSTLPTYAATCQNTNAYSSACSCFGATKATTTIAPCSTTTTVRSTKTRTVPASTITRTAPAPVTTTTSTRVVRTTTTVRETDTTTQTTSTTVFTSTSTVVIRTSTDSTTTATATQTVTVSPNSYNCSKFGYIVALETLYQIDIGTGEIVEITDQVNTQGHAVNALGYNALDNFLYGIQDDGAIVKIDNDGVSTTIGNLGSYANTGATDLNGFHWVAYGGPWWKIDVRPTSNTYGQIVDQGQFDAQGYNIIDWVFLPTHPGYLYSICGSTTSLLRFSMADSSIEVVTTYDTNTVVQADWPFNFATTDGTIYAVTGTGNTGQIWQFDVNTGAASFFVQGPQNDGRGDGARCVLNPNT